MRGDADTTTVTGPEDDPPVPGVTRGLLFLSHATPEDNTFATWLATQLAIAGYQVWCDTTKLLGGEKFWNDITDAIDNHVCRFLFVSTLEANRKAGTLRELRLAFAAQQRHGLKDFVVPLKIDAFPFQSMQEPLADLNCIRFDSNWADGLAQLLKLLDREGIPKSAAAGPACVTEWYQRALDQRRNIVVSDETCHSNWFRLGLPKTLHFHLFNGPSDALSRLVSEFPFPYRLHGTHLITFASLIEAQQHFGEAAAAFGPSDVVKTSAFLSQGDVKRGIASHDASNILSDLVRQAWDATLGQRGLGGHLLGSGLKARFFSNDQLQKNRAYFQSPAGKRSYRQMVGRKSKRTPDGKKVPDGFWHYALSASPQLLPFPRLVLRHHVIFTDDGRTPWTKTERMHKARRSVCKQWWNREWRDRLFAFTSELAGGGEVHLLGVGAGQVIRLTAAPMNFKAPWTYFEDGADAPDESGEIELIEDDEGEHEHDQEGT